MKTCSICKTDKDETEFSFKNKEKGTRSARCKTCHANYLQHHYRQRIEMYQANAKKQRQKRWDENFTKLMAYLREHPCIDCSETAPECLSFDHVRGKKSYTIASITHYMRWEIIEKEIAKCVVRCLNCHAKRTAKQFKWRKTIGQ